MTMRLTTRSCRLGGIISGRMKRWRSSVSTVVCDIGLPAFADAPVLCRKRSTWSTPQSHCLPPITSMEQRQNSPCHCLLNTLNARTHEVDPMDRNSLYRPTMPLLNGEDNDEIAPWEAERLAREAMHSDPAPV